MPEPGPEASSPMPETPGAGTGSHGEAGTAGEAVQIVRRTVAEHEQHEADKEQGE